MCSSMQTIYPQGGVFTEYRKDDARTIVKKGTTFKQERFVRDMGDHQEEKKGDSDKIPETVPPSQEMEEDVKNLVNYELGFSHVI